MSKESYPATPEPTPVPTSSSSSITIDVEPSTSPSDKDRSRCSIYRWCPLRCYCVYRLRHPHGVSPRWIRLETFVGTLGFAAKGIVYGFIGGMTCASASRLHNDEDYGESPKGAFILIGTFPAGSSFLFILLIALWCYSIWRFWECATYQGRDANYSKFKNFFSFRLAPFVSGCVYVGYSGYLLQVLLQRYRDSAPSCYPNCWRDSALGRTALVLMGIAFSIACAIQLQNALTKKWHYEINWEKCKTKYEKWVILVTGHVGYAGRAGIFLFVGVLMFKALSHPVQQSGDAMSDGLQQLLQTEVGTVCMMIIGIMTTFFGLYAILCCWYRHFPTPPPTGRPFVS
ncbi:uncharacterized protein SPPG_07548 [Spizellomyces punctatus DAOM BR117]|uniref:DUF1206 domain-containing protein n=1 Tax=Spizellomyces punctatus (strain DAOM BR117) TaxID=645134 RepID=A0A0L0H928_SPIPD|nr:uncharacterized protein SPPG_07548 [Spizellomyces punctatus DAOM BR117]KNC97158.1 hypothetical protein SPPG_07548 [Spizellomyces punctatus DAOM BR117]|eukprot:XP_016605198.1 hypothetical protein SPPG_07548 [Spizellomyces punctatus DAOM BR117]